MLGRKDILHLLECHQTYILMKIFYLFLALLIFSRLHANSQTINNYGFADYNACSWDWLEYKTKCDITYNKDGDKTLILQYDGQIPIGSPNMKFSLTKKLILPVENYTILKVSMMANNKSSQVLSLKAIGLDKDENIIFNSTAFSKNKSEWEQLSIQTNNRNIKALNIYIKYNGDAKQDQVIKLKDIAVFLDQKNISTIKGRAEDKAILAASHIVPLNSTGDVLNLTKIEDLKYKKIIALGESTHGSETISQNRFRALQTLIKNYDCKLVILEMPFDLGIFINAYAQGIIPETSESYLTEYLNTAMTRETLIPFLKWLKTYNQTALKKVYILGMDNSSSFNNLPLLDFHVSLLGKDKAFPYLLKLHNNEADSVLALAEVDTTLQYQLGKVNYTYYKYLLKQKFSRDQADFFTDRDTHMANRVEFLDTLFTEKNQKIAILAHSIHLQKIRETKETYVHVLGSLLTRKYKEKYFAIDFNFGRGTFTQDSCYLNTYTTTDVMKTIPKNSFEYAALKTGCPFFYFPAKYLNENINSTALITRNSQNKDHFVFTNLKRRFDAYIFINEGIAFSNVEKEPLKYQFKLLAKKQKAYAEIFQHPPVK